MRSKPTPKLNWLATIIVATQLTAIATPARAQLDETCKVTCNGRTVDVGYGGEFTITGIPAGPDLFRVYALCTKDGKTRYGRSGFVQIIDQRTFVISELDMLWRDSPFPTPRFINAKADNPVLGLIGQTTQVRVNVTFSDGSQKEINARGFGTTYRTSNPAIVTVDENGRVTARGTGIAFITVTNEGVTTVTDVTVAASELLTTIEGVVVRENGTPVAGAIVIASAFSSRDTTAADGTFAFTGFSTRFEPITVTVLLTTNNPPLVARVKNLRPIQNGVTDAGTITLAAATSNYVFWDGPNNGTWHTPANWSNNVVPGPNNDVIIDVPGNITVRHTQGTTGPGVGTTSIKSLLCLESFELSNGTLILAEDSDVINNVTLSGGELRGNGDFTVTGLLTWAGSAGSIDPAMRDSSRTIAYGGMNISGFQKSFFDGRDIDNVGTATLSTLLIGGTGSYFNNLKNATFIAQNGANTTRGTFNNSGTFIKSGAATMTFNGMDLNNTGTVDLQSGTLTIGGGSSGGASAGIIKGTGQATLDFGSGPPYTFSPTATISVPHVIFRGSTVNIGGSYEATRSTTINGRQVNFIGRVISLSDSVTISGNANFSTLDGVVTVKKFMFGPFGTLTGTSDLRVTGQLDWTGGALTGTGSITIAPGAVMTISGTNIKGWTQRTINNAGTVTWTGNGEIAAGFNATFNNLANATFDIKNDPFLSNNVGGTSYAIFNNAGTLIKSGGSGKTTLVTLLNNTGTVEVRTGTLSFYNYGGTSSGSFTGLAGTTLDFWGITHDFGEASTITAPRVTFSSGTANIYGSYNVTGSTVVTANKVNFGGRMLRAGRLLIIRGVAVNFTGSVASLSDSVIINFGTVNFSNTEGNINTKVLTFTNGTLTGSSDIVVSDLLTWDGPQFGNPSTMSGSGRTINNGRMVISGFFKDLRRNLDNAGVAIWTGIGGIGTYQGVVFNNLASGRFEAQNNASITGAGTINNNGTFIKSASTGTTSINGVSFNNTGTVEVRTGTLQFASGTSTNSGSFTGSAGATLHFVSGASTNSGSFTGLAGATLHFQGGTHSHSATSSISVPRVIFGTSGFGGIVNIQGRYEVNGHTQMQGGTANFTGNVIKIDTLTFTGGTANFNNAQGNINTKILTMNGGTANFSNATGIVDVASLALNNGELTGTSKVTVSGPLTWTGGTMSGAGRTIANGGMSISGPGFKTLRVRNLDNAGVAIVTSTANFNGDEGGTINNLAGATFDIRSDISFPWQGNRFPLPIFNNSGTFIKSGGNQKNNFGFIFNNDGIVDLRTGTLALGSGGTSSGSFTGLPGTNLEFTFFIGGTGINNLTSTSSITVPNVVFFQGTINMAGTYNVARSTTIGAANPATFNFNGSVVSVGDSLTITSGNSTANFSNTEGRVAVNKLNFTNGTLTGSSNVIVNSLLNWTSGTMSGTGKTTVNGVTTISGAALKTLNGRAFDNAGSLTWTGTGSISAVQNVSFANLTSGVFEAQNNAVFTGSGTFANAGTFRKSAATGTTTFSGIAFTNNGTVDVQSGILSLNNRYTQTQTPAGMLNINIGGLAAGTQFSRLTISTSPAPAATLNGTLNVNLVNNFTPALGNSFQIMTFSTRGIVCFDQTNLPSLPAGLQWQVACTGTTTSAGSLTLSVVPGSTIKAGVQK